MKKMISEQTEKTYSIREISKMFDLPVSTLRYYEDEGILTFVDEEGNDVRFEVLDVVSMEDKEYLVVLPLDEEQDEEEGNVLILEIKQEDGEEVYDTVTDDEEAEKVFVKFQEQNDLTEESEDEE